jgi:hypothetical protein
MFSDEEEEEAVNGRGRDSRERQRDEEEDEEVKEDKSFSPNRSGEQRGGGGSSRGGEKLRGEFISPVKCVYLLNYVFIKVPGQLPLLRTPRTASTLHYLMVRVLAALQQIVTEHK